MPGPPPPPPPMMAPPKAMVFAPSNSGGPDMRNALLGQIQKGAKLKKVQTVDKSTPLGVGKIAGDTVSSSRGVPKGLQSNKSSPDSTTSPVSGKKPAGGFANLTDELQFKLTLKKNKTSPAKEISHAVSHESSPAPGLNNSLVNEIKAKQSVTIAYHNSSSSPQPVSIADAIANKSSLFNQTSPAPLSSAKVINYGKPKCAPKPPLQLQLTSIASNSGLGGDSSRKVVARHQSMKSPRSPPVALSTSGPFNSDNHFGTMRMNSSNQQKVQDMINSQTPVQKPVAQRPTNKPPPPPIPNRLPGTNLSNNHAKSTNALNLSSNDQNQLVPRRLPASGSSNNISSLVDKGTDTKDSSAPPLPPHRLSSQAQLRAPQTPVSIANTQPPEVPRRHSSMKNSIENGPTGKFQSPNPNQPITRLVVDLEARYSLLFHNVSEFPTPRPYMSLEKSYPSRQVRQANGI